IAQCGTDALRLALLAYTSQGRNINLDINRVVAYRNFCNKLFNATKFAINFLFPADCGFVPSAKALKLDEFEQIGPLRLVDKWILSRFADTVEKVNAAFSSYDMSGAALITHNFVMDEMCDVYIEMSKPIIRSGTDAQKAVSRECLYTILDAAIRMLHPIIPYVTEELWQHLPRRASETAPESILQSAFPVCDEAVLSYVSPESESSMALVQQCVAAIRSIRTSFKIKPSAKLPVYLKTENQTDLDALSLGTDLISELCNAQSVVIVSERPEKCAAGAISASLSAYVDLCGAVPTSELAAIRTNIGKTEKQIEKMEKKMNAPTYQEKVPERVKNADTLKIADMRARLVELNNTLTLLESLA
ncbi:valine-tRNA ligase, partial [Kipferlia bialata]